MTIPSVQEMVDRGEVTQVELDACLNGDDETNASDDTVLDEYDGIMRMIKDESQELERFLMLRIDDLERKLGRVLTELEGIQAFGRW